MIPKTVLRERLDEALKAGGCVYSLAPVDLMPRLEQMLLKLVADGLLDEALLEEYRESLRFSCPSGAGEPRTIIVVATPSRPVRVRFHLADGPMDAVVPPTYISSAGRRRCLRGLRSVLGPAGFSVVRCTAPVKLLAVYSGLGRYGRNNLVYVKGMGSFARLDAFCTDADLGAEYHEPKGSLRLSSCPACRNCHHVCPTGCIPHDGTLIDAKRCLTYHNEHEGEWPIELDDRAHNSLVGCMRCQALCPANKYHLRLERLVAAFDREETDVILENRRPEELPAELRAKLASLDLDEYSTVLGRNLRALEVAAASRK